MDDCVGIVQYGKEDVEDNEEPGCKVFVHVRARCDSWGRCVTGRVGGGEVAVVRGRKVGHALCNLGGSRCDLSAISARMKST